MDNKFIIFTHSRSGSNSLKKILMCHPKINIISEPFNKNPLYKLKNPLFIELENVKDLASLDNFLKVIGRQYCGFKHFFIHVSDEYNYYILKKGYRIIFLRRKNILKTLVSEYIAEQTHIWEGSKQKIIDFRKQIKITGLNKISLENLQSDMNFLKNKIKEYRRFMIINKIPFFEVTYEEFYNEDISFNKKLEKINKIFEFLGYKKIKDINILNKIREIFDSDNSKINDEETYNVIPNIVEIENKLSSKKNGYLFKETELKEHLIIKLQDLKKRLENVKNHGINSVACGS